MDYEAVDTVLTFMPTSSIAFDCIRVPFIDDFVPEPSETLRVEITESSCSVVEQPEAIITILSECTGLYVSVISSDWWVCADDAINDGEFVFVVGFEETQLTAFELPFANTPVEICLTSSLPTSGDIVYTVSEVQGGTAMCKEGGREGGYCRVYNFLPHTAGSDFTGLPLTISILDGSSRGCETFNVLVDDLIEGDETVVLGLTGGFIDSNRAFATVTIDDNGT